MRPSFSTSLSFDEEYGYMDVSENDSLLQERIRIDNEIRKLETKKVLQLVDSNDGNDQLEDIKKMIQNSKMSYDFDSEFDFDNMIGPGIENKNNDVIIIFFFSMIMIIIRSRTISYIRRNHKVYRRAKTDIYGIIFTMIIIIIIIILLLTGESKRK